MHPPDLSAMDLPQMLEREWLVANGLGGYASSTLCGLNTRKYHGLLVAAMSPPVRRMVLLAQVDESVYTQDRSFALSSNEYPGTVFPQGFKFIRAFSAEPFPRWAYQADGFTLEKSLHLLDRQNTVCLTYTLLTADKPVDLELRPLLAMRGIHELMFQWNGRIAAESLKGGRVRVSASARTPEIFFAHDGQFHNEPHWYLNALHRRESERGYGGLEDLWNPGRFRWTLSPGQTIHLVCSTEPVQLHRVCDEIDRAAAHLDRQAAAALAFPAALPADLGGADATSAARLDDLIHAASAFIVAWPGETAAQPGVGVVTQYPWCPTGARAGLIGFDGLFLVTGRSEEGARYLHTLAAHLRDGLIPTEFSETGAPPRYDGADVSLWFINAAWEYFEATGDEATARALLPTVRTIMTAYSTGAVPGISRDDDGLLASTSPGQATSWMDAKLGEWVVTPRHGRQVELNALWFNALRISAEMERRFAGSGIVAAAPHAAADADELARRAFDSFNRRFWNESLGCCFDVIDDRGPDASLRPNQLLAASLAHPILDRSRHAPMLRTVIEHLLTPVGLRSLSPRDGAYQGHYAGGVVSRDRAQHQGCAYPWLLAPLARASLRAHGRSATTLTQIRGWLEASISRLQSDGLGQLCELFDGDTPHHPGGAIASAMSVGEVLSAYVREVLGVPRSAARTMEPAHPVFPATTFSSSPGTPGED